MRTVFLGTPEFAVPSFEALLEEGRAAGIEVVGVFTQPDRPRGRGLRLAPGPVKQLALEHGIAVIQPARIRDNPEALDAMRRFEPEIAVVVAFGQILPAEFFSIPPLGTLNVHASLLPAYRGAAPAAHAIWRGETETGVTIMKIDEGMDTGDVLAAVPVEIGPEMIAGELEQQLAVRGARLLLETIPEYASGRLRPQPQDHSRATLAPLLRKELGRVDWRLEAARIHDHIRALNPRPGAFCGWRGETLKLWRSRTPTAGDAVAEPAGTVRVGPEQRIEVVCGDGGLLSILELQLPSRSRQKAHDFVNGTGVKTGDRFE